MFCKVFIKKNVLQFQTAKNEHIMNFSLGYSKPIAMMIDSGAELNVLTERDWARLKIESYEGDVILYDVETNPKLTIKAYATDRALQTTHSFTAWVRAEGDNKPRIFAKFVVIKGGGKSLMGRETAKRLKVLKVGLEVNAIEIQEGDEFPAIPGVIVDFDVDPTITPKKTIYVNIPLHFQKKANDRISEMENRGIIEKVLVAPTWISGMAAVPKGKDNFRLVVDMKGPNRAIRRRFHKLPRVEEIKVTLHGSKIFTKLDLTSAFHHVRLSEAASAMTTFMSPTGMYRYKRLVFGVNCAPEIFQRVMEDVLRGINGIIVYIDDILIHAPDIETLRDTTKKVKEALRKNNLTLNDDKCEYEKERLIFLGHTVSKDGLNIDEQKVKDLRTFRKPKSLSELKSFLGTASYVSGFIARFGDMTAPLWKVANAKTFTWDTEQDEAFERVKQAISECTTTQGFFSIDDKTELYTDASPSALGAVLVQIDESGVKRIISFASKALTETEKRYAQTQREALAIVWACEHYYFYLLGHRFIIKTDAQGVSYIFNRDAKAPKRLLRRAEGWAMRLDSFDYEIEFIKGSENISDPSSRLFTGITVEYTESEAPCEIATITAELEEEDVNYSKDFMPLSEVSMHTKGDAELQAVIKALESGIWDADAKYYERFEEELRVDKGVVVRDGRALIPKTLQMKALNLAHKGHPGISKMKSILRERVWWRLMGKQTEDWVRDCRSCILNSKGERPVPMERTYLPEAPWDFLAADFCGPYAMYGGLLVIALTDYYSRMIVAGIVRSTDYESTEAYMGETFDLLGNPKALKTDRGTPFNSRNFEQFCAERGIEHKVSWPLTPQQNGMAEKTMGLVGKAMSMAKDGDYHQALENAVRAHNSALHRTTNHVPSDVMFGRRLRRGLPLARKANVTINENEFDERDWSEKIKSKVREDKKRHARDHSLEPGDKVVVKRAQKRKGETNFDPTELEVVSSRKGDITMKRADGSEVRRHITMVKKMRGNNNEAVEPTTKVVADKEERPKRNAQRPQRYLNNINRDDSDYQRDNEV